MNLVPLKRGPRWLKKWSEEIVAAILGLVPIDSDTVTVTDGPGGKGKMFTALQTRSSGGGTTSQSLHPFKMVVVTMDDHQEIRIVYGTVNSMTPDVFSLGDNPNYTFEPGGNGFAWIKVIVSTDPETAGHVDSVEVHYGTDLPEDTETEFYQQIGSYVTMDDQLQVAQAIAGSQWFQLCNGLEALWGLV